jgi:large conductance mechanosensitive channel
VTALVKDLLTPLIAAIFGQPDFSGLIFTVNGSAFHYGEFLNACLSFVFIAAAVYFFVVAPMNAISARFQKPVEPGEPVAKACPECLSDIPFGATRCKYCTAQQPAASA